MFQDWPFLEVEPENPICTLCGFQQLLVVQIYAPLENSPYHRTLYVFGCINPNCWAHPESWTCIRSQILDESYQPTSTCETSTSKGITATEWVQDADDWGDDGANDNMNEENGNLIDGLGVDLRSGGEKSDMDDEDESCSMEDSLRAGLEELYVDNKNANNGKLLGEAQGM